MNKSLKSKESQLHPISNGMRLLVVTQVVDREDPMLGFFHAWLVALAERFETITVICLREGEHALPVNVTVHSLGKEGDRGQGVGGKHTKPRFLPAFVRTGEYDSPVPHSFGSRKFVQKMRYTARFLSLIWDHRNEYDVVFVHMNQEYILIAGWLWKLLGKRIYLWRNHYAGSWLTDLAAGFCTKVFCTSRHSYTAKYAKTVFMPVGIDAALFAPEGGMRVPRSILFFSRLAPSKRAEVLLDALQILKEQGADFSASFYGSPLPEHTGYRDTLKERVRSTGLVSCVRFYEGVSHDAAPRVFRAHEIFVNTSRSGMLDKTIFEAAASGCLVLASSDDWRREAGSECSFTDGDAESLARSLERLLALPSPEREAMRRRLVTLGGSQDIKKLAGILLTELGD